jgi:N,N'-diacetyllegionaminate synthase
LARLFVRAAAKGGADLVKFQLVYADEVAVPGYQWYELFRSLEMPFGAWQAVREEAEGLGIGLAFDVFGSRSLEEALALGAQALKIHSTDFFNDALVDAALRSGPEIHLSLAGITADEVAVFLEKRLDAARSRLVLLAGFQGEPTPIEASHLARLGAIRAHFPGIRLGWMDHADGATDESEWLGVLAVPFGVSVIEKHVTLSRSLNLEDAVSALDPEAFRRYVNRIRAAEQALGPGTLALTSEEFEYRRRALKVVIAVSQIRAGAEIPAAAVALRRASLRDGREPLEQLDSAIGHRAARDLAPLQPLYTEDVA